MNDIALNKRNRLIVKIDIKILTKLMTLILLLEDVLHTRGVLVKDALYCAITRQLNTIHPFPAGEIFCLLNAYF